MSVKAKKSTQTKLPPIPEKLYFSIGEVAELCAVKPHVLRYWEQEFPVLQPSKRRGSRRYYQIKEIELIRYIRYLLYDKGFTISGARQQLGNRISNKTIKEEQQKESTGNSSKVVSGLIKDLEALLVALKD